MKIQCDKCHGSGTVIEWYTHKGFVDCDVSSEVRCDKCGGDGEMEATCWNCKWIESHSSHKGTHFTCNDGLRSVNSDDLVCEWFYRED